MGGMFGGRMALGSRSGLAATDPEMWCRKLHLVARRGLKAALLASSACVLVAGVAVWSAYGAYVFAVSPVDPWEKLAVGAIVIGILLLLTSVIWERYREWLSDPYRDVYR